ncbi:TRAP transporter small permease [Pseudomonas putida]|nr:TRAP transporter small permease [Pseudomonas putida]
MKSIIQVLEKSSTLLAGICLLITMLLISADAVARYLFHSPIPWTMDVISYYLMVVISYLAISDTFRHGDHIQLDLFLNRMSPRTKLISDTACSLLAACVFVVIAIGSTLSMIESFQADEFLTGYVNWPVWLSYLPISAGSALLSLRLIHHCSLLLSSGQDASLEQPEEA